MVAIRWNAFRSIARSLVWGLLLTMAMGGGAAWAQLTSVDLIITKDGPPDATNFEEFVYALKLVNSGPADANGATLRDVVPTGLTILEVTCDAASESNNARCPTNLAVSGQVVTGTVATFPNGGSVIVKVKVKVPLRGPGAGSNPGLNSYSNTATLTVPAGRTETNATTNTSTSNTSITYRPVDLSTTVVSAPTSFVVGDTLTYVIDHENKGTGPAGVSDQLRLFFNTNVDVQLTTGIKLTGRSIQCEASGGALCPAGSTWSLPDVVVSSSTLDPAYRQFPLTWPAGGKLRYTYVFKVDSYVGADCGLTGLRRSLSYTADVAVGVGLTDSNTTNNSKTGKSTGAVVPLPTCPNVDLTVVKMQADATWEFNVPKTYTLTYTNNGPGAADGSTIADYINGVGSGGATGLNFNAASVVSCVAENEAVCPSNFTVSPTGTIQGTVGNNYYSFMSGTVPTWPVGGKLTVVYTLTPISFARPSCGANGGTSNVRINNQGRVSPAAGLTDSVPANNNSAVVASNSAGTPWLRCPQADLVGSATQSGPLTFGQPITLTYTYKNTGPDAADESRVSAIRVPSAVAGSGITGVSYVNGSVNCTTTGGATCPDLAAFPTSSSIPNSGSYFYLNSLVDKWPSGDEITVSYTFTPTGYTGSCAGSNARARFSTNATVAPLSGGVTDPNPANNTLAANVNSNYGPQCVDAVVKKSVFPGTIATNNAMHFDLEISVPPAFNSPGIQGFATNVYLEDIVPAGFLFDPSVPNSVECTVVTGTGTCPPPGTEQWNSATRKFSVVIPSVGAAGMLRYRLSGTSIGYASTWPNTASVALSADGWDPMPSTNASKVSFAILDSLPVVTKVSAPESKSVVAGGLAKYQIIVSNPTNGTPIQNVKITDALLNQFTLVTTDNVTLSSATRVGTTAPVAGDTSLEWGTFDMLAGGVIIIDFTARVPSNLICGSTQYNNSAQVKYEIQGAQDMRQYDGTLIGNDADNVAIPCPPTLTKKMSPSAVRPGAAATLTFTLTPASDSAPNLLPVTFIDTLPSGLRVQAITPTTNTCGAFVTKADGSALTLTGGDIKITRAILPDNGAGPGTGICQISVSVTNVLGSFNEDCSANPAAFTNGPGNISQEGNVVNGVSNTCLVVKMLPLAMTKAFAPTSILENEVTKATLTISQPAGQPATTVSFVDALPGGLRMATTNVTGTCNGGNVSGFASIGGKTLTVSNLPIAANPLASAATCTLIFDVTHEAGLGNPTCTGNPAAFTNGVGNVTGLSANLTYGTNVCLTVLSTPSLDKKLVSNTIVSGGQTQLVFTISNGLGSPEQTGINFTDTLPTSWRIKDAVVQNTCGGTITDQNNATLAGQHTAVRLTGGVLADGQESCQITVNVTNNNNLLNPACTANSTTWTNRSANVGGLANLVLRIAAPQCLSVIDKEMTLAKRFEQAGQPVSQLEPGGATVTTVLTIGNPSSALALTDFELVDVLPGSSDIANDGSSPRGSTRSAGLTMALTGLPAGVTVQYSTATNPCRSTAAGANVGGALANLPDGCTAPNWQTTVADYSTVHALRFVGTGLKSLPAKTGTLELRFPLLLDAAAVAGDVFVNDAAATYALTGAIPGASVVRSNTAEIDIATASLLGTVFEDLNRNGGQDAGEAGLPGFVMVAKCVTGPSCVVGTQLSVLTGSDGAFSFIAGATNVHANGDASGAALTVFPGLASGTWSLTEIPPATPPYLHTASSLGSTGGTISGRQTGGIVLGVGATGFGYQFGEALAIAPTLGKAFSPSAIIAGGVSTMTWTLTNSNLGQIATLSSALIDTMPAGMVVAVPAASTTCANGSVTATAGASAVSLNAGAQIPAATASGNGSCTVSVTVTASPGGVTLTNTLAASALQTDVGANANNASADLVVSIPPPATLTVTKIVTPSSVAVTGAFPFTVQCGAANYSGSVTITANNTGTTTLLIPAGSAACEVTETVKVIPTAPQNYQWLTPVYSQPAAVIAPAGGALSATITNPLQSTLVSMTKAFAPATIDEGGTSTATMTISQPAGAPAATVSLTDTLPAGLALVSSVPVGGSCAAVASHVSVSGNAVTVTNLPLADNTSAAVQTCTITFGVTHAANRANASCTGNPADFTNGSVNVTNLSSNLSYSGSPCLTVTSVPQLDKRLASNTILSGESTSLVFTITNGLGKPAQAGIDFTDGFPANWRVADAVVGNTCGGILTDQMGASIAAGQTGVRLSGGVLAVNAASCQITLNVTNAASQTNADCSANPAAWTNGKTNIIGEANVLNSIDAPQCLKVVSQGITVAKAFEQGGVPVVQLESVASPVNTVLTITNPGNVAVTDFELVDVLPAASDKTVAGATRGSTRAAAITAALSGLPAGVTASYSTVANPCRSTDEGQNVGGTLPDLPAGCSAPAWQASVTDYSTVRAVRWVGTGLNVPALTGTLSMSFPLTVNAAAIAGDRIANDVAVTYQVTGAAALPNVVASNVAQLDMVAASLAGLVFEDTNGNGVQDPTEVGLPGAAIAVTCDAGPGCIAGTVYSMVTAADGSFQFAAGATNVFANTTASGTPLALFTGLLSGTWSLVETPPAGTSYQNTGSVAGTVNTVASGTAAARKIGSIALPMAGVGKDYVFAEMLAPANLVVTKVVAFAPGTAAMAMNGVYSFNVTCQTPTDTYPGAITITAGNTGFANIGLPAGSSACEVTEDGNAIPAAPANTQWLPAAYQQPDQGAVVAGGVLNATMTNTLASTIGGLSVSLQVQGGPAGYVPAPVPVYATCDKPVAGTRYPASGTVSAQVSAPAVIAGVPVGATCEVFRDTAAFPAAPSNYRWSKTDVQQPTGVMTSGGSLSAVVVATLAPLDPPFAQKVGKLVDKKEISWTMHLVNNNASNAGQPAAQFVLNDPVLPASGMTFVSGSVACVPFGAGQTTVSECTYDLATNTLRVAGALAYTGDTNAQTAAERVEVVFHVEVAKAGTYTNTATAQLNTVSGSPVTLTANVTVPADETDPGTVVPVPLWDMRAMLLMQALLMCLAYAALTKLRRRHRHGRGR